MSALLESLRGGLIVSCQAKPGSAIDAPEIIAALARAAQDNGAVAVRIQGLENLRAVRAAVTVPIVGLIKRTYEGYEPYITPTLEEIDAIAATGAEVIAFDATSRPRPGSATVASLLQRIAALGAVSMADCSTESDGMFAAEHGAQIIASTLCGYTKETAGAALPALDLVRALARLGTFVVCEGGVHAPAQGRAALDAGADAVVVGTAITNVDWLVASFAAGLRT